METLKEERKLETNGILTVFVDDVQTQQNGVLLSGKNFFLNSKSENEETKFQGHKTSALIKDFLALLTVCHTVIPEVINQRSISFKSTLKIGE